jgi:hypothetical protein
MHKDGSLLVKTLGSHNMTSPISRRIPFGVLILLAALLLSVAATYAQVEALSLHFLRVQQDKTHQQMLAGTAGNPWQYRILADLLIEPGIVLTRDLGLPHPESVVFIAFRFMQIVVILSLAAYYYRRIGLQTHAILLGLSILTWSMAFSLYNSDLSFNVFFEIAFFLLAGILIYDRKFTWLLVMMLPAALNRETSVFIPCMLGCIYFFKDVPQSVRRRALVSAAAGFAIYFIVIIGLRLYYGEQQFLTADGYYPGVGLLILNLSRLVTWEQLLLTLGLVPLIALASYRNWPRNLRAFFWVVVPLWIVIHFLAALVAETRLMLVPQTLVFIPGAMLGILASPPSLESP